MWRFMLVTFGFLAFAFYELSGGADYAPGENSIQSRVNQESPVRVASDNAKRPAATSVEDLRTTRLDQLGTTEDTRFEITLASTNSDSFKTEKVTPEAPSGDDKIALLTEPGGADAVDAAVSQALNDASAASAEESVKKIWPGAIELFSQRQQRQEDRAAALRDTAPSRSDIRYVTGNVVNMRGGPGTGHARVTSLTEGTEVAVLDATDDGWLMLRVTATGEEGWMADWLVSEPAN